MARTAAATTQDTLGLLAMGRIIVNLAQGEAQKKLAACYNQLAKTYGFICREYLVLRKVNEDIQKQVREYERIIDSLRAENGRLHERLSARKGG